MAAFELADERPLLPMLSFEEPKGSFGWDMRRATKSSGSKRDRAANATPPQADPYDIKTVVCYINTRFSIVGGDDTGGAWIPIGVLHRTDR
jgi:hypothetical protein